MTRSGPARRPDDRPRGARPRRARLVAVLGVLAVAALAAACGPDGSSATDATSAGDGDRTALRGSITVSAAASLTEVFTAIADDFEAANPGATVAVNFGSSGTLATQIEDGAPVDVAAFADEVTMGELADQGLVAGPSEIFATNQLVIVTEPGNPRDITSLADLADAGTISLCAATAPCGRFAEQVLADARVAIDASAVTRGEDVKTTLGAVTEGDAEAAIVYVTDARVAGDGVDTVTIPADDNVIARYPIAVVDETSDEALARAFVAYVLGPEARAVLDEAGFQAP